MQKTILKAANEYAEMAKTIDISAQEAAMDEAADGYIDDAMMRLYYMKALKLKLEALQAELDEQTDEQTFEATQRAQEAIEDATDTVFGTIEKYAEWNRKFRRTVENTSANPESADRSDLLRQLYRCEGILRMAYRTARHVPVYSAEQRSLERLDGLENEAPEAPEDTVYQDTGVDLLALKEVRAALIAAISKNAKESG